MTLYRFKESDAFASAIGGPQQLRLIIRRLYEPSWIIRQQQVGAVRLQSVYEGSSGIIEGQLREGSWVVFLPCGERTGIVNGRTWNEETLVVLPPASKFRFSCEGEHRWISAEIPTEVMQQHFSGGLPTEIEIYRADAAARQRLRRLLLMFFESSSGLLNQGPTATLPSPHGLLTELAEAIQKGMKYRQSRQAKNAMAVLDRAIDYINCAPSQALPVKQLAEQVGVSERTIRTMFELVYAVSPQKYMQLLRLGRAHQLLRDAAPGQLSIRSVATQLGFCDHGRFSSRYRDVFGQLPSQTLRETP